MELARKTPGLVTFANNNGYKVIKDNPYEPVGNQLNAWSEITVVNQKYP